MRFGLFALLLLAGAANAETFKCQSGSYWSENGKIIISAVTGEETGYGSITVAGKTYKAMYELKGFNRVWSFDMQADFSYNYGFTITLDGNAYYYDFSRVDAGGSVDASQFFVCK